MLPRVGAASPSEFLMPFEIERKFLVADETWREGVVRSERLCDGLIASSEGRKVRVRLYEDRATLTMKSKREGGRRAEYEYEIPRTDAEEMLAQHCGRNVVEKTRHHVLYRGFVWEVDVYEGVLAGVVLAEVELPTLDVFVPIPPWAGAEVTDRPEYKKINLLKTRLLSAAG